MFDVRWPTADGRVGLPSSLRCPLIAAIAFLLVPAASAQIDQGFDFERSGSAGFQFLKIGLGARESALGEAATALTNDANAVFWNVGALPLAEGRQAAFSHNEWLVGSSLDAIVLSTPLGSYSVGLSVARFGIEAFEETTVLEPEGTGRMVEAGDFMVGVTGARRFTDRLTIGVQAKYVRETLDDEAFSNVLFDVGALYYTGFRDLRIGFTLQHFGPDVQALTQDFRTPLLFRVAVADRLLDAASARVEAAVELVHPTDNNEWVQGGVEATLLDVLALRTGYRLSVDEGAWSVGAGVTPPRVGGIGLSADYAYVPFGDLLGDTHRFTVTISP
jgi:hypothetical protein